MRIRLIAAAVLLSSASLFGQSTANTTTEYFGSSALPGAWTCTGTSVSWYTTGNKPGFTATEASNSTCYQAWSTGTGSFDFRFNLDMLTGSYRSGAMSAGQAVALTTGVPGSMTTSDVSVVIAWGFPGFYVGLRTGELMAWGPTTFSADTRDISKLNGSTHLTTAAPGAHQLALSNYTFTSGSSCPTSDCYDSIDWPQGSNSASSNPMPFSWHWWAHVARDSSNVLTIEIYNDHFRRGQYPWRAWQYTVQSPYLNQSFSNIAILGYGTGATTVKPSALISNITAQRGITGTPHTVTDVIPTNGGGTITSGSAATVIGTNFNCSTSPTYNISIGSGTTLQNTTATCVDSTHLTISSLPSESNTDNSTNSTPYAFHVTSGGGLDAELNGGLVYHGATVFRFSPYEVPASPQSTADATFDVYGSGFSNSTTVSIASTSATVIYINPTHIQVQAPGGSVGAPRIIVTTGATTNYDSNTTSTYPWGTTSPKLNFAYVNHQYLWFNGTTVANLRSSYNNATFASWKSNRDRMLLTPGPFSQDTTNCAPGNCNSPLLGTASRLNMEEYLYHYLETGDSSWLTTWWNEVDTYEDLYRIDFSNQQGKGSFILTDVIQYAVAYDYMFASLTPARRAQLLDFFDSVCDYYYLMKSNGDTQFTAGGHNRMATFHAGANAAVIATQTGHFGIRGPISTPWAQNISATTEIGYGVTYETNYANTIWMSDGGANEGVEYANYGGWHFALFVDMLRMSNTYAGTNLTGLDQGLLNTNIKNFYNFVDQVWMGGLLYNNFYSNVGDAEYIGYGEAWPWLANEFNKPQAMYLADRVTQDVANLPDYLFYQIGVNMAQFWPWYWRQSATVAPAFTGWNTSSILSTDQRATLRNDGAFEPNFVLVVKGMSNTEMTDQSGHHQPDQGSFELAFGGEFMLADPGYQIKAYNNHNTLAIDGVPVATGSGRTTTFDSGSQFDNGTFRGISIDVTNAYAANTAGYVRRVFVQYANLAAFVLDDINPGTSCGTPPCGAVSAYYLAPQSVPTSSTSGFSITGTTHNLNVAFDGPTRSISKATTGWNGWVPQYEGRSLNTVTETYTTTQNTPMLTEFLPQQASPVTATVSRSSGVINVSMSDGGSFRFLQDGTTGKWSVDQTTLISGASGALLPTTVFSGKTGVTGNVKIQ